MKICTRIQYHRPGRLAGIINLYMLDSLWSGGGGGCIGSWDSATVTIGCVCHSSVVIRVDNGFVFLYSVITTLQTSVVLVCDIITIIITFNFGFLVIRSVPLQCRGRIVRDRSSIDHVIFWFKGIEWYYCSTIELLCRKPYLFDPLLIAPYILPMIFPIRIHFWMSRVIMKFSSSVMIHYMLWQWRIFIIIIDLLPIVMVHQWQFVMLYYGNVIGEQGKDTGHKQNESTSYMSSLNVHIFLL